MIISLEQYSFFVALKYLQIETTTSKDPQKSMSF